MTGWILRLFLLLYSYCFLISASSALAAGPDVVTSVTPGEIRAGERFSLQIQLRGALSQAEPDLSPLEAGFEILGVNQSQRQSYVDGAAYDQSSIWEITLLPRSTGRLEIPALSVGSTSTAVESILVSRGAMTPATPLPQGTIPAALHKGTVAVHVNIGRLDPYEQERVLLRLRLYAGEDLIEGSLAEPRIPGATIERLGEDEAITEVIDGRRYQGIERVYAVTPEAAGDLVMPGVAFEGLVRDDRNVRTGRGRSGFSRRSLFDDFFGGSGFAGGFGAGPGGDLFDRVLNRGRRRVVARSEPLTLHVRPRPTASDGSWWLPASGLSLEEEWSKALNTAHVGEVITRRITLRAQGASALQLPPLTLPEVSGVKQYTEAPKTEETETGAVRVQEATVIPMRPGSVTFPAIEVAWWDTRLDAARTATLPARTIEILPSIGGTVSANSRGAAQAPDSLTSAPALASPTVSNASQKLALEPSADLQSSPMASWRRSIPVLGMLCVLGIGTAIWLWGPLATRRRGGTRDDRRTGFVPGWELRAGERALRRACRESDPHGAELALREVAGLRDPQAWRLDIGSWARELGGDAFECEVARLRVVQYSSMREDEPDERREGWSGTGLWNAYRVARKQARKINLASRNSSSGLPPLYPEQASAGSNRGARGVA